MNSSTGASGYRREAPSADVDSEAAARIHPSRDVAVQIVGRFANLVLAVFVTILVVRSLGDESFGEWSSLLAVITIAGALCDLGFTQVTVRRAAADRSGEPAWIGALVQLRFILSVAAFVASCVTVIAISRGDEMRLAGLVLSATLLMSALGGFRAILQLRVRNDLFVAVLIVNSLLWGAAAVVVFSSGGGLVELAVGFFVALAIANALLVVLALRHGTAHLTNVRDRWPEMLRVGIPVAIGSVLILSYGRIDQILVLELAGAQDAGLYGAVYRILDQAQFVPASVATTVMPILAASYLTDPGRFRFVLQNAVDLLIACSLGALVFALAYGESFVVLLFGGDFEPAGEVLPVLVAALVPVSLGYLLGILVIITERQRVFVLVASAGLVFNVVANLVLIPRWGFVAAAWVTLVTEVLVLILAWLAVRSRLSTRVERRRIVRIVCAAGATMGVLLILRALGVAVGAAMATTAIAYPAALLAFGATSITEVKRLLRASRIVR